MCKKRTRGTPPPLNYTHTHALPPHLPVSQARHFKRNQRALEDIRRFIPPNIWTTTFSEFKKVAQFRIPGESARNRVLNGNRRRPEARVCQPETNV